MTPAVALALLTFAACLSPMLTFLALWQLKEWRMDRLLEHLQKEGFFLQLLGRTRPAIIGLGLLLTLLLLLRSEPFSIVWAIGAALATSIGIGAVQFMQGKQRMPRWTMKALTVFVLSIALNVLVLWMIWLFIERSVNVAVLFLCVPLLQSPLSVVAGIIIRPLDWFLKIRLLAKARKIRASQPNLTVIGITGSVGKTTTKELLAHILKNKGALATPLHVNTELGVSKWLVATLKKEPTESERILIVEMGAYRKGEIALLCSIAKPTLGVITAVGRQHLALFGSVETIVEAKGELFEALPENGHAFGNKDNAAFDLLKTKCRCPLTSVGTAKGADLQALDIEETGNGIRFSLEGVTFSVPLFGTHTVTSILLAIAVVKHLHVPLPEAMQSLRTFQGIKQTFEVRTAGGITILDDTYNLSPESFRAAIEWAARQSNKRKVLVTEGIIELGKEEESIHRELARQAASVFDLAFVTHQRTLPYFKEAFGDKVALVTAAEPLSPGDLLVCTGRLSPAVIDRFTTK